ncbi:hypothetical protein N7457_000003 (mitochondrion) [Penicillium paradoxum]|jgi:hypothetical protein
MRDE